MSTESNSKLPTLFWIVVVIAVIWNALGVMAYFMEVTMSEEAMAELPAAQQALYAAQPAWVTGAFAIAVFAGLAGSIALALRKGIATPILAVSLVAVVVQMFYIFVMSDTLAVMGTSSAAMPALIIVIGIALLWFSMRSREKHWIA
jgi:hypothetical protein